MSAFKRVLQIAIVGLVSSGCAQLHHVQYGDIDFSPDEALRPFEIKLSETGVSLQEAADVAKVFAKNKEQQQAADDIAGIIGLFQMGPSTGKPVYVKDYAKNLVNILYEKCPSGRITGLMSVRETRSYPVISGEIVKVTGYCMERKGS